MASLQRTPSQAKINLGWPSSKRSTAPPATVTEAYSDTRSNSASSASSRPLTPRRAREQLLSNWHQHTEPLTPRRNSKRLLLQQQEQEKQEQQRVRSTLLERYQEPHAELKKFVKLAFEDWASEYGKFEDEDDNEEVPQGDEKQMVWLTVSELLRLSPNLASKNDLHDLMDSDWSKVRLSAERIQALRRALLILASQQSLARFVGLCLNHDPSTKTLVNALAERKVLSVADLRGLSAEDWKKIPISSSNASKIQQALRVTARAAKENASFRFSRRPSLRDVGDRRRSSSRRSSTSGPAFGRSSDNGGDEPDDRRSTRRALNRRRTTRKDSNNSDDLDSPSSKSVSRATSIAAISPTRGSRRATPAYPERDRPASPSLSDHPQKQSTILRRPTSNRGSRSADEDENLLSGEELKSQRTSLDRRTVTSKTRRTMTSRSTVFQQLTDMKQVNNTRQAEDALGSRKRKARLTFMNFDEDRDGALNLQEFTSLLQCVPTVSNISRKDRVMDIMRSVGIAEPERDVVRLPQFYVLAARYPDLCGLLDHDTLALQLFRELDPGGEGLVDAAKLEAKYGRFEANELLDKLDKDHDGKLSFEDLRLCLLSKLE